MQVQKKKIVAESTTASGDKMGLMGQELPPSDAQVSLNSGSKGQKVGKGKKRKGKHEKMIGIKNQTQWSSTRK